MDLLTIGIATGDIAGTITVRGSAPTSSTGNRLDVKSQIESYAVGLRLNADWNAAEVHVRIDLKVRCSEWRGRSERAR